MGEASLNMEMPADLVKVALRRGQTPLNEYDSKRFLSYFGIPVCRENIAADVNSVAKMALEIGFPVVLKACGPTLTHKTDVSGVVLHLRNGDEVKKESQHLMSIKGCEVLLVQEMVKGNRELVCGLTRNDQFGSCIMFGLGGILTEVIEDIVFRVAPLSI
jgi:acyl-CoA synthetase (NDP forming)